MAQGFLSLILHAHLPYVRHPEHQYSLEEKWLYEALTECYIPILIALEIMKNDGVNFRLTFSLSPTLLAMMEDPLLRERYARYLERLQNLARLEEERTAGDTDFAPLARLYREHFDAAAGYYHRFGGRLVNAFRSLAEENLIEVITSASTHAYLPLLQVQPESVYAQAANAVQYYTALFGEPPRGIWLPECAYYQGLENYLGELGVQYFITATHGVLYASPRPKYGVYSPILTPAGVAAFGRDPETSKQVWSSQEGYPGDYDYREFYRDIAYDLPLDYIGPHLHPPGMRSDSGIKYYRITRAGLAYKEPYRPEQAREKAAQHAGNFMFNREQQVKYLASIMGRPPIVVSPYDAELFGHWWFEGPQWLEYLCRKIAYDQGDVKMITPGEYLDLGYPLQLCTPNPSSWGDKGHNEVWLNGTNDWIYRHLHRAAEEMIGLATEHPAAEGLLKRALNQAARELFLAQSSDWPFIMSSGTMVEYAHRRITGHLVRFRVLSRQIRGGAIDEGWLKRLEETDNLYPHIDYRLFQSLETTVPREMSVV
ncbi:MAG: 1,4-alpha-glucan branching protein domain-containing protein [Bacillota bacterium]